MIKSSSDQHCSTAYRGSKKTPTAESAAKRAKTSISKTPEFQVEHIDAYTQHGIDYPPTYPQGFAIAFHAFPQRIKELIWFKRQTQGELQDIVETLVLRDMNMSLGFGSDSLNICPCTTDSYQNKVLARAGCLSSARLIRSGQPEKFTNNVALPAKLNGIREQLRNCLDLSISELL